MKWFNKVYEKLTDLEKEMLNIIAISYKETTKAKVLACAEKANNLNDKSKAQKLTALKKLFKYKSLCKSSINSYFSISDQYYPYAMMKACQNNDHSKNYLKIILTQQRKYENTLHTFQYNFYSANTEACIMEFEKYSSLSTWNRDYFKSMYELFSNNLLYTNQFDEKIANLIPECYIEKAMEIYLIATNDELLDSEMELLYKFLKSKKSKYLTEASNILLEQLLVRYFNTGDYESINNYIETEQLDTYYPALFAFMEGDLEEAKNLYIAEIQRILGKSKKKYGPPGIHGFYFCMTMIALKDFDNKYLLATIDFLKSKKSKVNNIYNLFEKYIGMKKGRRVSLGKNLECPLNHYSYMFFLLFLIDDEHIQNTHITQLGTELTKYIKAENDWFAYNTYCVLKVISPENQQLKKGEKYIAQIADKYYDITKGFEIVDKWQRALMKLTNIVNQENGLIEEPVEKKSRIVWFAKERDAYDAYFRPIKDRVSLSFYAKEQIVTKQGTWSKGRSISSTRLKDELANSPSTLSLDKKIIETIDPSITFCNYNFEIDTDKALPFLIKHPHVFLDASPNVKCELVKEEVTLIISEEKDNFKLSLSTEIKTQGSFIIRETSSRYKILDVTEAQFNIAKLLKPENSLYIPKKGEEELKSLIAGFSSILTVHSDIQGEENFGASQIATVETNNDIHVHLLPIGDGIQAELFVRPFGEQGPYFKPGHGGKSIISEVNGENKQVTRDLNKETKLAEAVIHQCPTFSIIGEYETLFEFDSPEDSLEALLELQEIKDTIKIDWPEGEKFKVLNKYSLSDMSINVHKSTDWFELDGELKIDENEVLNLQKLLALQKESKSRFIELKSGEFIALTKELEKKIASIADFSFDIKGKTQIHPLLANSADAILAELPNFKSNKAWKSQIKKAIKADKFEPVLPTTLQANLRDYQVEGFNWLSRLAQWKVGACLADDMGLGKTLQAIAVILERAKDGPTLVIAPSSVCLNWIAECAKFAPTLRTAFFGDGDRDEILKNLQPFDLIVCSYGLLMSEEEKITEIEWTTTVLDEAQAIKNFKAKRTKAALKLKSGFRIITTGTPVENHLSELWSLFNFINPGFLGTQSNFSYKFAVPIEKNHDKQAQKALKNIIKPFILRRLKTEVLDELPAKTEINLSVELSKEEKAFYEALRRESLENIEQLKDGSGGVHIQVLAELTKLRRACCHPSLISPKSKIKGSKLELFIETVLELRENNHKVLVFSQFTSYLSIIKKACDKNKISYQYLDGSTPTKKRQERVNAFQSGEGDIFLISLKAGGTGLNLTAADFVIHMDPWWNPAVEDQASDRAHRIGQKRPVTVYRFVTKSTIEEKIIGLHKTKRALADSLLDGTDSAGKLSVKELLNLLK